MKEYLSNKTNFHVEFRDNALYITLGKRTQVVHPTIPFTDQYYWKDVYSENQPFLAFIRRISKIQIEGEYPFQDLMRFSINQKQRLLKCITKTSKYISTQLDETERYALIYAIKRERAKLSLHSSDIKSFFDYISDKEKFKHLAGCTQHYLALEKDLVDVLQISGNGWKNFVFTEPQSLVDISRWLDLRLRWFLSSKLYASILLIKFSNWWQIWIARIRAWRLSHIGDLIQLSRILDQLRRFSTQLNFVNKLWEKSLEVKADQTKKWQIWIAITIFFFIVVFTVTRFIIHIHHNSIETGNLAQNTQYFHFPYNTIILQIMVFSILLFLLIIWSASRLISYSNVFKGGLTALLGIIISIFPEFSSKFTIEIVNNLIIVFTIILLLIYLLLVYQMSRVGFKFLRSISRLANFIFLQFILFISFLSFINGFLFAPIVDEIEKIGFHFFFIPSFKFALKELYSLDGQVVSGLYLW